MGGPSDGLWALWRHEAARCGWLNLGVPPAVLGACVLSFDVAAVSTDIRSAVGLAVDALVPLVAGVAVVQVVVGESATELLTTLNRGWPAALVRRLLLLGSAMLLTAALAALLPGQWPSQTAGLIGTVATMMAAAGLVAAWNRTGAAASATVVAIWLGDQLVLQRVASAPVQVIVGILSAVAAIAAFRVKLVSVSEVMA